MNKPKINKSAWQDIFVIIEKQKKNECKSENTTWTEKDWTDLTYSKIPVALILWQKTCSDCGVMKVNTPL